METTLFEAVITPHRSLSARGQRMLALILAALLIAGTSVFAIVGAWPVGGFAGAELLVAIAFFRWHARQRHASELIILTQSDLRIIRTNPAGRRRERRLPPAWLSATMEEHHGRAASLVLTGQGHRVEIAQALGEVERRDLAAALNQALHTLRHPRFDNPTLR